MEKPCLILDDCLVREAEGNLVNSVMLLETGILLDGKQCSAHMSDLSINKDQKQ